MSEQPQACALSLGPGAVASCRPASVGTMTARPLYLAQLRCTVDLDGPALLVRASRRAPARYPLPRVSRVVSAHGVDWKMRALSECLVRGIPIVFLNSSGVPVGYLQPAVRSPSRLNSALEELLARPDWHEHYGNFLRAERMRVILEWECACQADGKPLEPAQRAELIRHYVHSNTDAQACAREDEGIHRAAVMALVAEQMSKAGLRPVYPGFGGVELNLCGDLCGLLALSLEFELHGLGAAVRADAAARLRIFHAFAAGMKQRCQGILGRLHRRIRQVLEEWR